MGVPKFYRWISERYPCLSSVVKEDQIPKFDNFYLDMNGIIHHCSHPNDSDVNFRITEDEIFRNVFNYIEVLFTFIRPQRVLFLAVDGVAPRAKMNQQRGRRFRSAKEAKEQEQQARQKGKIISEEARFDSNCITPGTDFMERLDVHLQYMIARKVSTDPSWKKVDVYYSSHLVPGEGEHKILDFVRFIRSQRNYDPYTRHCLYGLDADLVMLGLSVHEPFMSLLREEINFGRSTKANETNPEKINFHLLHLSILRDYLGHEFEQVKGKTKFEYDQEKIIDDWILLGFLVGNDFIPHLPGLHINKSAFDDIYAAYIRILPTLDGYINEGGVLNLLRFQALLAALEKTDLDRVEDELDDIGWMETKRGGNVADELEEDLWEDVGPGEFEFPPLPEEVDQEQEAFEEAIKEKVRAHKEKYYRNKLCMVEVNEKTLGNLACEYVRAIQWNLHYYYHGVPSWEWFYPYNYAPYVSDLKDFGALKGEFELGTPFKPFEQLMAVLPAASKKHLPQVFHHLFSPGSPIYDFYPEDFATDLNGKINEWEAVVLIPFIDEARLLEAVRVYYDKLTDAEKRRNTVGSGFIFRSSVRPNARPYPPPSKNFSAISPLFVEIMHYDYKYHCLPRAQIRKGRNPQLRGDLYLQGFPTLGFVEHKAELKRGDIQVFQRRSEARSIILNITADENLNYLEQGIGLLGKTAFVNWPFHTLALITKVTDGYQKLKVRFGHSVNAQPEIQQLPIEDGEMEEYEKEVEQMQSSYAIRKGIVMPKIDALVYAKVSVGKRYSIRKDGTGGYLESDWSPEELAFPVSLVTAAPPELSKPKRISIEHIFPMKSKVYLLGFPYYGCEGMITSYDRVQGTVEVTFDTPTEPMVEQIRDNESEIAAQYEPAFKAASVLGLTAPIVSRITGTVFAKITSDSNEKANVGLSLKATKQNTEMKGYTKRVPQHNNPGEFVWLYSERVLELISAYRKRFPELFHYWQQTGCQDPYIKDIYKTDAEMKLEEIKTYLTTLPTYKQAQQTCGSNSLDEYVINAIESEVSSAKAWKPNGPTRFRSFVHPRLIYRYTEETDGVLPDASVTWQVYDRVVMVREGTIVPVGLRGTVISFEQEQRASSFYITTLFDESFPAGDHNAKIFEVPAYALVNLSHGKRKQLDMEIQHGIHGHIRAQPVRK